MTTIDSDAQCLEMIAKGGAGRRTAVEWLYKQYYSKFRLYFLKNRMTRAQAEDVVQDTFVKIVRSCDTFRKESDLAVWLWTVAKNCMNDHFRKVGRTPALVVIDGAEAEKSDATRTHEEAGGGLEDCVRNAFKEFSVGEPERASALRLVAIEGWSGKEIAAYLERTPGAAREYLSQCRKAFKPFMEPCQDFLKA